eukprot:SAG22_NODE_1027_length_5962_cov_53.268293_3_plen_143_part_00
MAGRVTVRQATRVRAVMCLIRVLVLTALGMGCALVAIVSVKMGTRGRAVMFWIHVLELSVVGTARAMLELVLAKTVLLALIARPHLHVAQNVTQEVIAGVVVATMAIMTTTVNMEFARATLDFGQIRQLGIVAIIIAISRVD